MGKAKCTFAFTLDRSEATSLTLTSDSNKAAHSSLRTLSMTYIVKECKHDEYAETNEKEQLTLSSITEAFESWFQAP